jgi:hypothetical protein
LSLIQKLPTLRPRGSLCQRGKRSAGTCRAWGRPGGRTEGIPDYLPNAANLLVAYDHHQAPLQLGHPICWLFGSTGARRDFPILPAGTIPPLCWPRNKRWTCKLSAGGPRASPYRCESHPLVHRLRTASHQPRFTPGEGIMDLQLQRSG